ncbi:DUF3515 domain-containing protein [Streptomyces sp. NPDC048483]|uniref:DUF3515 domain-containing protein n=1 Tax=Streptomyces sp. NPDC048483 TaxID=3154927 RepID=UPI0034466C71
MRTRRLAVWGASLVAVPALAAMYLFAGEAVSVPAPEPKAKAQRMCAELLDAVPDSVAGGKRRETDPSSPYTAAWGDPAMVLRCGVVPSKEMDNPRAPGGEIGGVGWMLENLPDGGHRCTTTLRKTYVEVTIPAKYGDVGALMDLAEAIKKTVPEGLAPGRSMRAPALPG